MSSTRRQVIAGAAVSLAALSMQRSWAQPTLRPDQDRVFICNEDSNTLAVIDPMQHARLHGESYELRRRSAPSVPVGDGWRDTDTPRDG
jgi:DNA-binding beta-propeller fold protein YncE